jgi:hypothetical protein
VKPRLADPGVPTDQRGHRAAGLGVVEQREQAAEFVVPPDHAPGRHPQHHKHKYPIRCLLFRLVKRREVSGPKGPRRRLD